MTLNQFITSYNIRPADAIVMKKKLFGMADHYVIYLGIHEMKHVFVANYTKGVKVIPDHELQEFLQILEPTKIDPYPGPEAGRNAALNRAISKIGQRAYNLITNNCEHFKNYVHYGRHTSKQADNAIGGLALGVGAVALFGLLDALFSDKK